MKKIYLATPYTAKTKWFPVKQLVQLWRFLMVSRAAMRLMMAGYAVYSPISHTAPISCFNVDLNHKFWLNQDWPWFDNCDELFVLKLRGYDDSHGVQKEIERAWELDMPIMYLEPKDLRDLHYFQN